MFWVHHRLSVVDLTGGLHKCELVFEFLDPPVRVPQGLTLGLGDTVGEPGVHPPLRLPPVQRLFWDTGLSHQTQDAFTGEHAINKSWEKRLDTDEA